MGVSHIPACIACSVVAEIGRALVDWRHRAWEGRSCSLQVGKTLQGTQSTDEVIMKLLIIVLFGLFGLAHAGAARADGCGGNLIDHKPVSIAGERVGELQLYYNSGNGRNCAVFAHLGSTRGKPLLTSVEVYVCKPNRTNCGVWQWDPWWDRDDGTYAYQAGPVRIDGRDKCVQAMGYLDYRGQTAVAVSGVHCR
ncbi:hypothetical protein ACDH70_05785 [Xanthomonas axonopodis pv. poinsettiicola]|uniref:hypothetical protein n=1 Tax=Xanthomonas TaxID=338 RepID=UPI001E5AD40E|nr:hypothetical protein [Xanthomonas codiaei]MCC8539356.1 hypothetical protein [Xanthomonas codiaei]